MYYFCQGCDECCRSCCQCCEDCCGGCCDAISNCFTTPFSFCTFITFFVGIGPFIIMIIGVATSTNLDCQEPIKPYLIVQGINNLVNFLFCLYITMKYGYWGKYQTENQKTFWQQTVDLILYDWFVCIYIIALIFFVIWLIISFNAYNSEPDYTSCQTENNGFLMISLIINLICMIVYLILGFIIFIVTVIIYSCDEGSCSCCGLFTCCISVITCGQCNFGKKNTREQGNQKKNKYSEERKSWLQSSKRLCGCLSLNKAKSQQNDIQQGNIQYQPQNQQHYQQQPYYQQPQQQQQQQQNDESLFGRVTGWLKKKVNGIGKEQQPQQFQQNQQQYQIPQQQYQQQVYIQQQPNQNYQQYYIQQQQPQPQPNYQYPAWGK